VGFSLLLAVPWKIPREKKTYRIIFPIGRKKSYKHVRFRNVSPIWSIWEKFSHSLFGRNPIWISYRWGKYSQVENACAAFHATPNNLTASPHLFTKLQLTLRLVWCQDAVLKYEIKNICKTDWCSPNCILSMNYFMNIDWLIDWLFIIFRHT
jgi:hypothetical protein